MLCLLSAGQTEVHAARQGAPVAAKYQGSPSSARSPPRLTGLALARTFKAFVKFLREPVANPSCSTRNLPRSVAAGLPVLDKPFEQVLRMAFLQFEGSPVNATARLQSDVKILLDDEAAFHSLLATVGGVLCVGSASRNVFSMTWF